MRGVAKAVLVAIGMLLAAPVIAADLPTKKPAPAPIPEPPLPSSWRFEITGYGWATSVTGNSGFGALPTLPYFARFTTLLEHLQGALMGAIVARNDTFIVGLDSIWSKIGGGGTIRNRDNPLFGGQTDLTLGEGITTGFGGVRIPVGSPNLSLYGTVGARYIYSGTKLSITGPLGIGTTQSVYKNWVDPVAGIAGQYKFDDRWFMNTLADIGGWSDSATGQGLASVGYNWTPSIATTLGYRVLYIYEKQNTGYTFNFEPRSFRYQQWMYGPFAGFKYSF
ncbi:MAG: hypothetical protein JO223_25955 [Hyphomicrobiales bacterium]|nr:hypothetical protein [Hyphomicrobiales bacterium]MBV8439224.1 hypothetical protein [Hyphomicrobiales bacterium]